MAEGLSKNFNSNQNDRLKPPKAPNSQHISELTVQDIPRNQTELLRNSLSPKEPQYSDRNLTKQSELNQLEKFQKNMEMLTKTTFEVVDQFQRITGDLDVISEHIEKQKNRKEEINVMADLLDEKLQSLLDANDDSP